MHVDDALSRLDRFEIETPSWGYADTGTRFGKFLQPAAARTIEEKIEDAATVHAFTGCCPRMAAHVLWDFPEGVSPAQVAELALREGIRIGSINPNLFQDQIYKYGSAASPNHEAREAASTHVLHAIEIAQETGSEVLSLWFPDGTNYPAQDDLIRRKRAMAVALRQWHDALPEGMSMLVEYKPFEPAFYHTDIADWGMAYTLAQQAGARAKVLVDTGHHLPGTNIEHIVAFLLDEGMLGGFHFNDRKYADDDLTIGSIDPYAVFRIFAQIVLAEFVHGIDTRGIAYMIDQSHNLKPKVEAMVQTAVTAQELYLKALLVPVDRLLDAQARMDIVGAEEIYRKTFYHDVNAALGEWRRHHGREANPLEAYRTSGIEAERSKVRSARRAKEGYSGGGSYA